jgi:hypothetical protein
LIDCIEPHKAFLKELRSTGGRACLDLQFLGDSYFADEIPQRIPARLIDLELDFGIDCFADAQRKGGMKNIQVIDGALNCTFSIFQATEEAFALLFLNLRQDIQYDEDLALLPRQEEVEAALGRIMGATDPEAGCAPGSRDAVLSRPIIARNEKTQLIVTQ